MRKFLSRLSVPEAIFDLVRTVIQCCPDCNAFAPVPHRPRFGAELAGHFGDVMVADLFYIFNLQFLMMIDEAIRYKVVDEVVKKDAPTIGQVMLRSWIRYFGPPKRLKFDQEGAIRSEEFATICDRFSIHRQLAGSDESGKHTTTGLAERHIALTKIASLKCDRSCEKKGIEVSKQDIVFECAMGQNCILEYGGFSPNQCLMGHNPRGMFELCTDSPLALENGNKTSSDTFENYLRLRMTAKVSVQKSIVEARIAEANNSKPHNLADVLKLRPMKDEVDLYRTPEKKDTTGWRGLDLNVKDNTAIVKHQSLPYLVPLRHVREHMARIFRMLMMNPVYTTFFMDTDLWQRFPEWNVERTGSAYQKLHTLLDLVDGHNAGEILTIGSVHDPQGHQQFRPPDFQDNPPEIYGMAKMVGQDLIRASGIRAIRFGTQLNTIPSLKRTDTGTLVAWLRGNRSDYVVRTVEFQADVRLKALLERPVHEYSVIVFLQDSPDEEEPARRIEVPNMSDISAIDMESEFPDTTMRASIFFPPDPPTDWWHPPVVPTATPPAPPPRGACSPH